MKRTLIALLAATALTVPANAATNLLVDGDFENPLVTTGGFQTGFVAFTTGQTFGGPSNNAWTVIGPNTSDVTVTNTAEFTNPPTTFYNANSGLQWLDLTGTFDNGSPMGVSQTVALTAGGSYNLMFFVGTFVDAASSVNVKINGTDYGTYTNLFSGVAPGNGINWVQFNIPFIAPAINTTIAFIYAGGLSVDGLDDVSLTQQVSGVPEPGTWTLMALGFLGLAFVFRRMKTFRIGAYAAVIAATLGAPCLANATITNLGSSSPLTFSGVSGLSTLVVSPSPDTDTLLVTGTDFRNDFLPANSTQVGLGIETVFHLSTTPTFISSPGNAGAGTFTATSPFTFAAIHQGQAEIVFFFATPQTSITLGPNTPGLSTLDFYSGGGTVRSAVPEPATWAMMLLGFVGLGFAFRLTRCC